VRALNRLATRAIKPTLGNQAPQPRVGKGVSAATQNVTYGSPGNPMYADWDARSAVDNAYFASTYVERCVRTEADTIAGLPFRVGPDPSDPDGYSDAAPMARLLGPAPGGPNTGSTARTLWAWSIVQFLVTGRWAWQIQVDQPKGPPVGLWPLVSAYVKPVPTAGGTSWFDSYVYSLPTGDVKLRTDQVFYAWRPSARDFRQPESALEAARTKISVAVGLDRYQWALLKNNMVASHIVISPPFDEPEMRRAFQEQFVGEFSGYEQAGKTIFAEAENDYDSQGKMVDQAKVQVIPLAQNATDASLIELSDRAESAICIALGVPRSLIGDASQRTYANADSEYRSFWTLTVLPLVTELQDYVNVNLAPRFNDDNLGWFDLSKVTALQPPTIFAQPSIKDAIDEGVVTPAQAAEILNMPLSGETGIDTTTALEGELSSQIGAGGTRSLDLPMPGYAWERRSVNTFNLAAGTAWKMKPTALPRVVIREPKRVDPHPHAIEVMAVADRIRSRRLSGQTELERLGDELAEVT
jgi:HK97 family phage portal protein